MLGGVLILAGRDYNTGHHSDAVVGCKRELADRPDMSHSLNLFKGYSIGEYHRGY